jgi:hypothetical protein
MTKYVRKDESGKIVAWANDLAPGIAETPITDAELDAFLNAPKPLDDLTPKEFWRGALSIDITEDSIKADIDQMPGLTDAQKEDLKIAVSKATSFARADPDLVLMLNYKGYDDAQIDTLWQWVIAQREPVAA